MTTTTASPSGTTPRRWPQFRLRTLLVVMALVTLVFALLGAHLREVNRQVLIVQHLIRQPGVVDSSYQVRRDRPRQGFGSWFARRWVWDLRLTFDAEAPPLEPGDWEQLAGLTSLRTLTLVGGRLGADEAAVLQRMAWLRSLSLENCDLGPGMLKGLARLELKALDLSGSSFAEEEIAHLRALVDLQSLNLSHTPVSEAAVWYLAELPELRELHLVNTVLDDEALQPLVEARPMLMVLDD